MKRLLAFVLAALFLSLPVLAQDTADDGPMLGGSLDIVLPDGWTLLRQDGFGVYLRSEHSQVRIRGYSPYSIEQYAIEKGIPSLFAYVTASGFGAESFDPEAIEPAAIGTFNGSGYLYDDVTGEAPYQRQLLAYEADNGFIIAGFITPLQGAEIDPADVELTKTAMASVTPRATYKFYDGTTFDLAGWTLQYDENQAIAAVWPVNESYGAYIGVFPRYADIPNFENPRNFLNAIFQPNMGDYGYGTYLPEQAEDVTVNGQSGIYYAFNEHPRGTDNLYPRGIVLYAVPSTRTYITAILYSAALDSDLAPLYDLIATVKPGDTALCLVNAPAGVQILAAPSADAVLVRETAEESLVAVAVTADSGGVDWFGVGEGFVSANDVAYHPEVCALLPRN